MTFDGPPLGKTWSRVSLIRTLTGAKAQIFASAGVGLLVWADVISVKVPFYFLNKATLVARKRLLSLQRKRRISYPISLISLSKTTFPLLTRRTYWWRRLYFI